MVRVIAAALAALLLLVTTASATQNAVPAYNNACATYNFAPIGSCTECVSLEATFAEAYQGSSPQADFFALWGALNEAMGTHLPPGDMEDVTGAVLPYWPDA